MFEQLANHWPMLVLIAPVLALLWAAAVLTKYVRLMLNIFRDTPLPVLAGSDYARLEGRQVWFRSYDGTRLRGMLLSRRMLHDQTREMPGAGSMAYPLSSGCRGVVVFCHELGSDRHSVMRYCRGLLEAGFDVFSFDFRGHGDSETSPGYRPRLWCTDKEVADCLGALVLVESWIQAQQLAVGIGLFGISRGGGAAVLAAAAALRGRLPVRAVVTDGAFSSDLLVETYMRKWVHIFARVRFVYENHRPAFWRLLRFLLLKTAAVRFHCEFPSIQKSLRHIRRTAMFFIHGEKDSYIPAGQAQKLYEHAATPRYLWVVPDARHNQAVARDPAGYGRRTVEFFEKHLAGAIPSAGARPVEAPRAAHLPAGWPVPGTVKPGTPPC